MMIMDNDDGDVNNNHVVMIDDDDRNEENLSKKCHFAHRVVEAAHFELANLIQQESFKRLLS